MRAAAWVLSHFIRGLLFETDAADPVTFAVMIALLLAVALAGCYLPAQTRDRGESAGGDADGLDPLVRQATDNTDNTDHGTFDSGIRVQEQVRLAVYDRTARRDSDVLARLPRCCDAGVPIAQDVAATAAPQHAGSRPRSDGSS